VGLDCQSQPCFSTFDPTSQESQDHCTDNAISNQLFLQCWTAHDCHGVFKQPLIDLGFRSWRFQQLNDASRIQVFWVSRSVKTDTNDRQTIIGRNLNPDFWVGHLPHRNISFSLVKWLVNVSSKASTACLAGRLLVSMLVRPLYQAPPSQAHRSF
jgi:hypothetical protein